MAQRERSILRSFVLCLLIAGCGGGDDDSSGDGDTGDNGDGDGADAGIIGDPDCATPDFVGVTDSCDEEPCLAVPEFGFQIRDEGTTIQSGEDVEYCEVVMMPGDPSDTYYIKGFDSAMSRGSHHLIVGAVIEGSQTDENTTPGDRTDCVGPDGFGGDLVDVTGQQLPYHQDAFPEGVGRIYHGGQKLIFNYHYLNATEGPLEARAAVNFYTAAPECVEKVAESAGFYKLYIPTPQGETSSFTKECTFSQDVMVTKLSRHTHQWGTDFPVYYEGGANDGDLIYTSPSYEDPDYSFEEPILVKAGEGFRWTCNYDNDSDHDLMFGPNATDEMCILFATIYSPDAMEVAGDEGCFGP
jgi:hypothetical protein